MREAESIGVFPVGSQSALDRVDRALEQRQHVAFDGTTILPGNVLTDGLRGLGEEYLQSAAASIPLGHLGDLDDVGYAALFLATDEAKFITGQTIVVDGGQTLPEAASAMEAI